MFSNNRTDAGASDTTVPTQGQQAQKPSTSRNCIDAMSITDSAYQSIAESSTSSVSNEPQTTSATPMTTPKPLKGTDLLSFKKQPAHNGHFRWLKCVQLALEACLQAEVHDLGYQPWHNMSLRPMVLGKSESDATVYVVVFCPSYLKDLLNRVLASEEVRRLLTIPHTTTTLQHLVIPSPPHFTSQYLDIDVCCQTSYVSTHDTHCGTQILLMDHDQKSRRKTLRKATFGGIVKVFSGQGAVRYYGMTAGHIVNSAGCGKAEQPTISTHNTSELAGWITSEHLVGRLLNSEEFPGITANRAVLTNDWSIFEVAHPHPNRAVQPEHCETSRDAHLILTAEKPHFTDDDESRPVLALGAERGSRRGELSNVPARIWLAHSSAFVDAYVLETEEDGIYEGDSGAWVVHATAAEFYGHVVATNTFGEAYVMPAIDTLANIRECLGATSVTLPSTTDLLVKSNVPVAIRSKHVSKAKHRRKTSKSEGSIQQYSSLRMRIRWDPRFFQHRMFHDRPFKDTLDHLSVSSDVLEAFFSSDCDSWQNHQVRLFFDEVEREHANKTQQIYLNDKHHSEYEAAAIWLDPSDLLSVLSRQVRSADNSSKSYRRRLIFVPSLNKQCLSALLECATWYEGQNLREAVRTYTTSTTCLKAALPKGFPSFQLVLNVTFFTLSRESSSFAKQLENFPSGTEKLRTEDSIVHLARSVKEHSLSVVISGCSNFEWHGYAFGAISIPLEDSEDADFDWDEDSDSVDYVHCPEVDLFAAAGDEFRFDASAVMWDPRIYFLRAVQIRLDHVLQANTFVVHTMKSSWKAWLRNESHLQYPLNKLRTMESMFKLLIQLRDPLRDSSKAWSQFNRPDGDVLYFADINDTEARNSFKGICDAFEGLRALELSLIAMIEELKTTMDTLQLRMNWETFMLNQGRRGMERSLTNASEDIAKSARHSRRLAAESNRVTRVNVQLLMTTTALIISLQYFTSEHALFAFERSPRNFFISVCVLVPSLLVLTFTLHTVDRLKDAFMLRSLWEITHGRISKTESTSAA